eukprot:6474298-Amphidinium_carterae.1
MASTGLQNFQLLAASPPTMAMSSEQVRKKNPTIAKAGAELKLNELFSNVFVDAICNGMDKLFP